MDREGDGSVLTESEKGKDERVGWENFDAQGAEEVAEDEEE